MKKVVAVGFSCVDVYDNTGEWYATGNGIDWGIHLSRMGLSVSAVTVVGDDAYGEAMKQTLQNEGLNLSHLRTQKGDTCVTRMELQNGVDRVHLETIDGVMSDYRLTKEEIDFVSSHDLLHTDLFGEVLGHLPEWKAAGVEVLMDFSVYSREPEYHCETIFPWVDDVFFSADGIGKEELKQWMQTIASYGPKLVVATMGEEGSLAYDGKQFYSYGIVPAQVVNTVGAGDSYIAGFTYGLLSGEDILSCMKRGAELSSSVIEHFRPY